MRLASSEVVRLRVSSFLLADAPPRGSVLDVARWFGAMQAQDLASAKWSFGVRLGGTEADVDAAIERFDVVRTWPMRGTLHFVPAEDARWMLALTGARALAKSARRRTDLGIDERTAEHATEVLGAALAGGVRLTRAEALAALEAKGIATGGQRGYHLLGYAAHRAVVCVGPNHGKEQTFASLADSAPSPRTLTTDEALGLLATRYFQSHGPASLPDFVGWTGLTTTDARRAIAIAGRALAEVEHDGASMWLSPEVKPPTAPTFHALPGFDELVLGLKDRSLLIPAGSMDRIVPGGNGVFRATMVEDGRVIGTWTRALKKRVVAIEAQPFTRASRAQRTAFERACSHYGRFLGLTPTVTWP